MDVFQGGLLCVNREKTAVFQGKLKELMNQHQTKEASLHHELQDTQEQLKNAVDMCAGELFDKRKSIRRSIYVHVMYSCLNCFGIFPELDLKLKLSQDRDNLQERKVQEKIEALTKEKEELLDLSMQRGKIIQVICYGQNLWHD